MKKEFIRIWKEEDIDDIEKHLIIVGDTLGDCASCRALGLDYAKIKECPSCKTVFKYITAREVATTKGIKFQFIRRVREKRPDLVFIDHDDYKAITGKLKANRFFKD